jgi:hypothetical protein
MSGSPRALMCCIDFGAGGRCDCCTSSREEREHEGATAEPSLTDVVSSRRIPKLFISCAAVLASTSVKPRWSLNWRCGEVQIRLREATGS